jgi:SAM-dependent methyltransferase
MAALSPARFQRGFEPGCSIGILTSRLATICDELVAIDLSPTAVNIARERCRALPHVAISCGHLPEAIPMGPLDLIVLSEIGYYFELAEWDLILRRLLDRLQPGGVLLAVHWLGVSSDHVLHGDQVHERIHVLPSLTNTLSIRHVHSATERYRLDRWQRR